MEPMTYVIPHVLHLTSPDPRAYKNPIPTRAPYIGKQNQNQENVPTILKSPIWATEKYSVVEDIKRTIANMSMFDMLQNCPDKRETMLKILDHAKAMLSQR